MSRSLILAVLCTAVPLVAQRGVRDGGWPSYGGDSGSTRYSTLDQIDRDNFGQLQLAWTWESVDGYLSRTGTHGEWWADARTVFESLQQEDPERWRSGRQPRLASLKATPLMVDGVLYLSTPLYQAAAIDAVSGRTLWQYNPKSYEAGTPTNVLLFNARGVAYWSDGEDDARIYWGTGDGYLLAVDARTGRPCVDFGEGGRVDLMAGIPRAIRGEKDEFGQLLYSVSSPPIICGDVLITGSAISDRREIMSTPPGDVRAWDVRTGELLWTFHTIPREGEFGIDTWEQESWRYTGSANVWTVMSVDHELGYVYLPTGTPSNDYYGGHRPGDNLFAESLICVDVETGERVWHFQAVHHGVWDYDLPSAPILADIVVNGKPIKAVAQLSKQGFCYVFDRVTGEPVWPIEERPVPQTGMPGDTSSLTQPFPTRPPPYAAQGSHDDELIDFTPELHAEAIELLKDFTRGPLFTPQSPTALGGNQGTIQRPGLSGASTWHGGAFDPETGLLYVPSRDVHSVTHLYQPMREGPMVSDYTHGGRGASPRGPQGLPIFKPPYSRMTAIDLNRGEHRWMVPSGIGADRIRNHPALRGMNLPAFGGETRGGPIVTKTLMICSRSAGRGPNAIYSLVAYDKATGEEIAEVPLPSRAIGTPMTYMVDGIQYLAITVSGRVPRLVAYSLR